MMMIIIAVCLIGIAVCSIVEVVIDSGNVQQMQEELKKNYEAYQKQLKEINGILDQMIKEYNRMGMDYEKLKKEVRKLEDNKL